MTLSTRLRHLGLALKTLPKLLLSRPRREVWQAMHRLSRELPRRMQASLPELMRDLTPTTLAPLPDLTEEDIRDLVDLTALLDRASPLGLCLRRSLLRYHFLRRYGLPLTIQFGAKFTGSTPERQITGHAWVTLDGQPYHEAAENWRDFTVMVSWPDPADLDKA